MVIGGVATLVLTLAVVLLLVRSDGAKAVSDNAAVIGAVIALGGVFTAQMVSIALDNRRTQHEALQTYLAKMSELLLDEKLHEKKANFDPARVTARLQTLAVLERLDAERKRTVLLFLREAQLINRNVRLDPTDGRKVLLYAHYVGLRGADLSGADLSGAQLTSALGKDPVSLSSANLKDAKLSGTILPGADLSETDLRDADLRRADLTFADLRRADLRWANLSFADLRGANLIRTKVSPERLAQAKELSGATMPDGQILKSIDNPDRPTFQEWLKSKGHGQ